MANSRYWNRVQYVDGKIDVSSHKTKTAARAAAKGSVNRTHIDSGAKVEVVELQERLSNGAFLTLEVFRP